MKTYGADTARLNASGDTPGPVIVAFPELRGEAIEMDSKESKSAQ